MARVYNKHMELKELKIRLTPEQKAWLEKRAERYEGNVSLTLRKLIEELIKIKFKGLQ